MAKQKIYELAKELNKQSKDIVEFLNKNGVEVKSHMSSVEDAQIEMVKKAFAPKKETPKAEAPKAEAPKAETVKAESVKTEEAPKAEKAPKKKKIIALYNSQNSRGGVKPNPQKKETERRPRPDGERRPRPQDGERRPFNRDGQNNGERRPFNRDGQNQNNGERRPFNRDFNKDKDNDRNDNRRDGGRRDNGRRGGMDIPAPEKPLEKNRSENRHNQNQQAKSNKKVVDKFEEKEAKMNKAGKFQKPVKAASEVKKDDNEPKVIQIPEKISVQDLAEKMKMQPSVIIKKMFLAGKIMTINTELDFEQAGEIAMEYNFEPEAEVVEDVIEKFLEDTEDSEDTLVTRPPVVCVMGHVDHGKTSLLDAIRHTNVTDREAGGITQHIGAYTVNINGQKLTFLDTPGHEAFTSMRMRGANSTDIAILVVAADDGVMPQTVEAISHAKAAGVEIIVAINKIDKEGANPDRVLKELAEHELIPEDWGGSTVCVPVSAKKRIGIENLLEMVLLTAEMLELKANPKRRARGLVIEAELDKGKGPVATVLVQKGTLRVGDAITAGIAHGKVRAMMDDKGRRVKEAGPSTPVEILGFSDVPQAGDVVISPETEKEARTMAEAFIARGREKMLEDTKLTMSLDDL